MISFMMIIGSWNSQNMIGILKQWRNDSPGNLCDGYCMDIMCGGKNFLRISYFSFFECKGPWMLKTGMNCQLWNRGLQN